MSAQITMYSTPWCGYCKRLKSQLDREGITFDEVDIEQKPEAADYVMSVNNGNQTVPTVIVVAPGGKQTVMTNPSLAQVKAAERLSSSKPKPAQSRTDSSPSAASSVSASATSADGKRSSAMDGRAKATARRTPGVPVGRVTQQ